MFGMMSEERCSFVRHIEVLVASMCMCIPSLLSLVPLQDWASAAVVELLFAKAPCPDCCCAPFGVAVCRCCIASRIGVAVAGVALLRVSFVLCSCQCCVCAALTPVLCLCFAHASVFALRFGSIRIRGAHHGKAGREPISGGNPTG